MGYLEKGRCVACSGCDGQRPEEQQGQNREGHSLSDEGFRPSEAPWTPLSSAVRGCDLRLRVASFNIQIFILIRDNFYCGKICAVLSHVSIFVTLWTMGCQAPLSIGKNTGVGCHALLQGILPTQGMNPRLLCLQHWQAGSLPLVPPGKPVVKYM